VHVSGETQDTPLRKLPLVPGLEVGAGGALSPRQPHFVSGPIGLTSGAIAARFDCTWPTNSQHLRVLEKTGLVSIALRGRERVYRLETERLRSVAGGGSTGSGESR
jgi:DNA-binding transcriptional ArsR family regulator